MNVNQYIPTSGIYSSSLDSTSKNNSTDNQSSASAVDFSQILKNQLQNVNDQQVTADDTTNKFIQGDSSTDIHQVMLATSEAQLSLDAAVQIRNKIVQAYQTLNQMQV
ncbi:MAG: flagellar hook-basal body complex protein FliE [Clostridium sp.]|nr:flagellar hook-basal body complex protein FliE [Clostridium sp.]